MVIKEMRKLKIGYWPLSPNFNSAGDRRRLVFWAKSRGHSIVSDLSQNVDVIVASENSDFNSKYLTKTRVPIIFDLIDAYLSPLNSVDDIARGLAKRISGQISGEFKPFSHHIRDFCILANSVVCSSVEQEELIKCYNSNTHVILDSHDELPFVDPATRFSRSEGLRRILWEGQPATIRSVKIISVALENLSRDISFELDFVTDVKYFEFLNKFVKRDTLKLLERDLGHIASLANIIPWSPDNLAKSAMSCNLAVIPLDISVPTQRLKPENRMLIMWRLGIPCLTSPSPAYVRVAQQSGVNSICENLDDWSAKINRLLNDSQFAKREILAGQNYLRDNHNQDKLLKKWDLAFESVVG